MQKVFWRALEARGSCDCAICIPTRPGLVRKVNTLPTRRRIKFGDVVTIVYGTVLGTAAFYDGTSKKIRREKIDNVLVDILLENEAVIQDQEARLKALGYNGTESVSILSRDSSRQALNANWIGWNTTFKRTSTLKPTSIYTRHYSTAQTNDECKYGNGRWQAEMLARQKRRMADRLRVSSISQEPLERIQSGSKNGELPIRIAITNLEARVNGESFEETWDEISLLPKEQTWQIRETAIAQLVLKLLKTYLTSVDTKKDGNPSLQLIGTDGSINRLHLQDVPNIVRLHKELSQRMESIKQGIRNPGIPEMIEPFQFPQFRVYDQTEDINSPYHYDIKQQNDKLIAIFLQAEDAANLISELCRYLVSRRYGPDIHTMNLLLLFFLDVQWYQACKAVISTISAMRIKENKVTCAAKLQYYHLSQQDSNLDRQRTLMLCLNEMTPAFEARKLAENIRREQELLQPRLQGGSPKSGWSAEAFSIIVIDLLDRGKLTEALAELTSMRIAGLQQTPEILEALLQYCVFHQHWDLVMKYWARFEQLGYERSVLTWYWMLQACATCRHAHMFYKVVDQGIQQGILDGNVEYSLDTFRSSVIKLKQQTHALRRLQYRIPIPHLPQRDLCIQSDDIIQMPNLEQTMLVVYLQYVKLRSVTSGWIVDHLSYLHDAKREFQDLVQSLHATPEALQYFRDRWTAYDAKLRAFTTIQNGGRVMENTHSTVSEDGLCVKLNTDTLVGDIQVERLPAASTTFSVGIAACNKEALPTSLESSPSVRGQGRSELRSSNDKYHRSLEHNSAEQYMQTPKNRQIWVRCIQPPVNSGLPPIRFVIGKTVLRRVIADVHPVEAASDSVVATELLSEPTQPRENTMTLRQTSRSTQISHQIENDIEIDDTYLEDYRIAMAA